MKNPVKLLATTLLLFILAGLFLVGCSAAPAPQPVPTPDADSPITLPAEIEDEDPAPGLPALAIQARPATEELLAQFNSYRELIEPGEENAPKIILSTDIAVRDFRFLALGVDIDEEFNIEFYAESVLYTIATLTPDEAFVVTWQSRGTFPHRGISFVDETDTIRVFALDLSGDGSIWLTEIL